MGKVPIVPRMSAGQIEAKAIEVLKDFCPEVWTDNIPVPVDRIFDVYIPDRLHVRTGYTELRELGIQAEGYTNSRQMFSLVDRSLVNDFTLRGTRRFRATVGHESGHCFLHIPIRKWQQSLLLVGQGMKRERSDLLPFEDPEWQAWRFCQALCMPSKLVKQMLAQYGSDYHGITKMMERFDMNFKFVLARLKSLKIPAAEKGFFQRRDNPPSSSF